MNGKNLSILSRSEDGFELGEIVVESPLIAAEEEFLRFLSYRETFFNFFNLEGDRLFAKNIFSRSKGANNHLLVCSSGGANHYSTHAVIAEHRVQRRHSFGAITCS